MTDLTALPLIAEIAHQGSFAKAARQLNMPTTSLSRKIQQLEQTLGGRVFHRTTRALSLTELGERLLPKAQLIYDTQRDVLQDAEHLASEPTGTLRISASRALCQGILVELLSGFTEQYPQIRIKLDAANRYQDLATHGLDFAFRAGELADSSQIVRTLGEVSYALVASPGLIQQLNQQQALHSPEQLYNGPAIVTHIDGKTQPWQLTSTLSIEPTARYTVDDLQIARQLACAGQGVAYLPVFVIKAALHDGQLQRVFAEHCRLTRPLSLIYPQRSYLPRKSRLFIDYVTAQSEQIAANLAG